MSHTFDPSAHHGPEALLKALSEAGHRERLLGGLAQVVIAAGYRDATVADVVRRARVSRRTFYEHFSDLDDCFIALNGLLREMSMARIVEAIEGEPEDVVSAVLDAYVAHLSSSPELLVAYLDHLPATGPRGSAFDREGNRRLATLVAAARAPQAGVDRVHEDRALVLVAGVRELVRQGVDEGRPLTDLQRSADAAARALLP